MKKFFSLLLAVPMLAMLASCDDDNSNDLPDVSVSIEYSGASMQDGILTIEQGDTLTIDALKVTPAEGTKEAALGNVVYYLDGYPFFATGIAPHGCKILTSNLSEGDHTLSVHAQILQVDRPMGYGLFRYTMKVVAPSEDNGTPTTPDSGTDTPATTISDSDPVE